MTDSLDQATDSKDKVSLTLWVEPEVIESLNELVLLLSCNKRIRSKSEVVSKLVEDELHALKVSNRRARSRKAVL